MLNRPSPHAPLARLRLVVLGSALALVACQGVLIEPGVEGTENGRPAGRIPDLGADYGDPTGTGGLRRLSPMEAEATVADLLGELGADGSDVPIAPLPEPQHQHGFQNPLEPGQLSLAEVQGMLTWAETISERATADLPGAMGCTPGAAWDACVSDYASRLAGLAFRRPPEPEELARMEAAYVTVTGQTTPTHGVRALWELVLVSPDFWYLSADTVADGSRLTPDAIASQLSYGLWGTMPDPWLRARVGELTSEEQVRAVADEMLDDPRAAGVVARFHRDWLNVTPGEDLDKDPALYPELDGPTRAAVGVELDAFVNRMVLEDRPVADLFASREAYVNQPLERLYGLDPVSTGQDDWQWRELGPERAGVLTRSLVLASTAGPGESSIVHRGVQVLEQVLCTRLTPPPGATEQATAIPPGATSGKMAAVEDRAANAVCSGCHDTIDPLGVAFETFDAIGGFRVAYPDGVPIAPGGSLAATYISRSIDYADAAELMQSLARTDDAQLCYASKWSEWLTGAAPNDAQRAALFEIASTPDISIREILLRTLTSPMFLDRMEIQQ